ncbi:MAG: hypothetical protein ACFFCW_42185 [Candidatus Hodarchaeota archaeon]
MIKMISLPTSPIWGEFGNTGSQVPSFPDYGHETLENGSESAREIMEREGLTFTYIKDPKQAAEAMARLCNGEIPLGLDTETAKLPEFIHHKQAGLEPHLSRIRLVQLYGGGDTVYLFDMYALDIEVLGRIWNRPLVAHNAVFDMKHLLHAGAETQQLGCTMLMANTLTGKLPSLAELAQKHLGWNMSKAQQTSDWNAAELTQDQLSYAALDAVADISK